MRSLWLPALVVVFVGCQDPERKRVDATHVIVTDTAYYSIGPQQAQPSDGTLRAGTKVTIVEEAGSYVRVRSLDGTVAYVAADALNEIGGQTNSDMSALVNGNNQFAFELYGRLRAEPGNLFFSPSSISTALAMTYGGARAGTASQMADVLHFDLAQDQLDTAFTALLDRLRVTKQGRSELPTGCGARPVTSSCQPTYS
jgi:hypothetical protein